MSSTVLRIDSSARYANSVTRDLVSKIIARLNPAETITRDVAKGIPQIDDTWVDANFTPAADRTDDQKAALALSDDLVAELKAADTVVIGLPIYNFGVPAALKAWIDQIARAGLTFQYSESGPKGLLEGKRAIVVIASGGVEAGSDYDFATGYIQHLLGFIGITDVQFVNADRLMMDGDAVLKSAEDQVNAIAA